MPNETLREISSEYQEILYEALNAEELSDEVVQKLKHINDKFDEKIESMAHIIQEIKAKQNAVGLEIERLKERSEKWKRNLERLLDYIKNEMISAHKTAVDTAFYTVKIRKTKFCEVDEDFLREAKEKNLEILLRVVPERIEPDKKAIKDFIIAGNSLNHARIAEKETLNIK